jgi:hypothetical protein
MRWQGGRRAQRMQGVSDAADMRARVAQIACANTLRCGTAAQHRRQN